MVDFRRRGEDELGHTVFRGQSRRGRVGKRRRPTARFLERLEERTLLAGGITGFNNGVGWTANNNGTGAPTFTANTLVVTNGIGQARSAFYNTLQPTNGPWTASFTYLPQPIGANTLADGVTFMLQNQGPTALGPDGSGLGMAGITPSAEIELNIYNGHVIGTAFETDGANSQVYMPTGAVDLASGDPIGVVLSYSGTTLTETLTDLTTTATFSTSYTVNLQSVLGLSASRVGFTGATGDGESVQTISGFSFSGSPSTTLTGTTGNAITGVEGSSTGTVQLGTFTDADQSSTATDYTTPPGSVVVNWGDGSAPQILAAGNLTAIGTPNGVVWTINAAHTYTEEGTYAYTVTVTDVDGAATTVDGSAIIADAALTAGPSTLLTAKTGVALPSSTVVGTFTDANTFGTIADFTGTIGWGDGSPLSTAVFVATATPGLFDVEGGHTYAKAGVSTTLITVHDDGGSQVVITGSATVTDLAVTGSTENFIAVEGQNTGPFVLATFTDPNTLATVADVQATLAVGGWGDGTPTVAGVGLTIVQTGVNPSNGDPIFNVVGSHTYAEETSAGLPDTLSVIITTSGGASTTLTSPPGGGVTVLDAPLSGSAGNSITGIEGTSTGTVLLGTFVDANQAATVADYTTGGGSVVVNWGDGSAPQTLVASNLTAIGTPNGVQWTINAAHTYTEEGTYNYTVTVTDDGGASTVVAGSAVIADASLTAGAATLLTAHTGVALPSTTVVGTFTDGNTFATTADYTGTIGWGDGSPLSTAVFVATATPGVFDVEGGHIYAKPGVYTTLITVHDDGGSQVVITGSATVTDLPVTGATNNFTSTEGQSTGTFALATFTDPNTLATVADVNATLAIGGWGDGTPTTAGVTLVVQQIGVTPLTSATNPGAPIFEVLGSHTYTEESPPGTPYALSVIITTLGGATTTLTSPPGGGVTVLDAPLTSSNGTAITGIEGTSTPVTAPNTVGSLLGSFTDANQGATTADYLPLPTGNGGSVVVNWGDGSALQTLGATNLTANGSPNGVVFTINASHDYVEEGTYAYAVTVTDDGGATTTFIGSAIIADAPLTTTGLTQPTVTQDAPTIFPMPVFAPPLFSGPVAFFNDTNPLPPTGSSSTADFTATIDWGDGTPTTAGTVVYVSGTTTPIYEVLGSHTYSTTGVKNSNGTYAIQVFVIDDGGSRLTVTNTATVTDNPLSVTGAINPSSVSGLSTGDPGVTNVTQPDFYGTVLATLPSGAKVPEGNADVTLTATNVATGVATVIGSGQAGSDGAWNIMSNVALPGATYSITATAVDQFGVSTTITPGVIDPSLLIDTVGPVITGAFFNRLNGEVDYTIQDPGTGPSGVWVNTLLDSSNYLFTKVHANKAYPGKWIVTNVDVTAGAAAGSYDVAVTFNSGRPIRGGFYLFTIRDSSNGESSVQDRAENHLDGKFYGSFPSGNGINGSDFVAELDGYHNKIFAPQTIIGTANAANGGVGGRPVGAVHSGHFLPIVPRGGGSVFGNDPKHLPGIQTKAARKTRPSATIKVKHTTKVELAVAPVARQQSVTLNDLALGALVDTTTNTKKKK